MSGSSTAVLEVLVFAGNSTTRHRLPTSGAVTIGRGEENDIRLDDPAVSRHHARIHLGPLLRIEDAGSANGTRLVAQRSEAGGTMKLMEIRLAPGESHPLELGVGIAVGSMLLVVQESEDQHSGIHSSLKPRSGLVPIVRDPVMKQLYDRAEMVAKGNISALLLGETGVGKEVLAETIHNSSPRARNPFICMNCAAFSETLLESELFGHEAGAFTGAAKTKAGLLEVADGGTVFLDEVGELPPSVQVKLLRVLEDRKVMRVGSLKPRSIDVRFIAATNRDLVADVKRRSFRQDLFFRLNGISLVVPPLRERPSEIEPFAQHFIRSTCQQLGRRLHPSLSVEALEALRKHDWPGNIRELRNVIERSVTICGSETIRPEDLELERTSRISIRPPRLSSVPPPASSSVPSLPVSAPSSRANTLRMRKVSQDEDRVRILEALAQCAGNQTRAAELLGISRRTLINRIEEYGLDRPRKKP